MLAQRDFANQDKFELQSVYKGVIGVSITEISKSDTLFSMLCVDLSPHGQIQIAVLALLRVALQPHVCAYRRDHSKRRDPLDLLQDFVPYTARRLEAGYTNACDVEYKE